MNLVPWKSRQRAWQPLSEISELQNEMDSFFGTSLMSWPSFGSDLFEKEWGPSIDLYDSKDTVLIKADLPGLKKDEINVSIENETLFISGEKKREKTENEHNFIREERSYGKFSRAVSLPASVDAKNIKASYKDGVLELVIPKKEEDKPKQIQIDVK